jgi:hypothetical protein
MEAFMAQLRSIEIDFDIHKLIEPERRGFEEAEYVVLRRLLKLPDPEQTQPPPTGRSWSDNDVTLPHKTSLRMTYGRQTIEGEIVDGKWVCEGQSFDTPSAAASALALTKDGQTTSLNGWNYWEAKLPGSAKWSRLSDIRLKGYTIRRLREARQPNGT